MMSLLQYKIILLGIVPEQIQYIGEWVKLECGFDFHGITAGGAAVIVVIQVFLV